jgi:hypothetical protein
MIESGAQLKPANTATGTSECRAFSWPISSSPIRIEGNKMRIFSAWATSTSKPVLEYLKQMVKTVLFMVALLLVLAFPTVAAAQDGEPRFEAGVLFTYVFLEQIGSRDVGVGTGVGGLGGRISYRLLPFVDLDGDLIFHPSAGVNGSRFQALLGTKVGMRFRKVGLFAKARPGFLYFSKDPFGVAEPNSTPLRTNWASSLEPSLDLGGVFEFYTSRGPIIRFDLGDTIINYESRMVVVSQLEPPRREGGFRTHNRQWSIGLSFAF